MEILERHCTQHCNKQAELVCITSECCKVGIPICSLCVDKDHRGHYLRTTEAIADELQEHVRTSQEKTDQLTSISLQQFATIDAIIQQMSQSLQEMREAVQKARGAFQKHYESLNTRFIARIGDQCAAWMRAENTENFKQCLAKLLPQLELEPHHVVCLQSDYEILSKVKNEIERKSKIFTGTDLSQSIAQITQELYGVCSTEEARAFKKQNYIPPRKPEYETKQRPTLNQRTSYLDLIKINDINNSQAQQMKKDQPRFQSSKDNFVFDMDIAGLLRQEKELQ